MTDHRNPALCRPLAFLGKRPLWTNTGRVRAGWRTGCLGSMVKKLLSLLSRLIGTRETQTTWNRYLELSKWSG